MNPPHTPRRHSATLISDVISDVKLPSSSSRDQHWPARAVTWSSRDPISGQVRISRIGVQSDTAAEARGDRRRREISHVLLARKTCFNYFKSVLKWCTQFCVSSCFVSFACVYSASDFGNRVARSSTTCSKSMLSTLPIKHIYYVPIPADSWHRWNPRDDASSPIDHRPVYTASRRVRSTVTDRSSAVDRTCHICRRSQVLSLTDQPLSHSPTVVGPWPNFPEFGTKFLKELRS